MAISAVSCYTMIRTLHRTTEAYNKGIIMRIDIIGTAGSGKTKLAHLVAKRLHYRHIELDSLYWGPQWTPVSNTEFQCQLEQLLTKQNWVIDGEYSQFNHTIWPKTDLVIWLDYPLPIVMWRLVRRGMHYALSKQNLWGGENRESLPNLFNQKAIIWKAFRSHHERRKTYMQIQDYPRFMKMNLLRFPTPGATNRWMRSV